MNEYWLDEVSDLAMELVGHMKKNPESVRPIMVELRSRNRQFRQEARYKNSETSRTNLSSMNGEIMETHTHTARRNKVVQHVTVTDSKGQDVMITFGELAVAAKEHGFNLVDQDSPEGRGFIDALEGPLSLSKSGRMTARVVMIVGAAAITLLAIGAIATVLYRHSNPIEQ